MLDRKWSMAHGKFKILTNGNANDLEESKKFKVIVLAFFRSIS